MAEPATAAGPMAAALVSPKDEPVVGTATAELAVESVVVPAELVVESATVVVVRPVPVRVA